MKYWYFCAHAESLLAGVKRFKYTNCYTNTG